MRVVLDTNIIVSALMSRRGPPFEILDAWRDRKFDLIVSAEQFNELRRVGQYPKVRPRLAPHEVGRTINRMRRIGISFRLPPAPDTTDPDDGFLLAMAVASDADYLITGDYRAGLLQRRHLGRTKILTPAAFKAEVLA